MYSRETVLKNKSGLHARPASDFVACAKTFSSKIKIYNTTSLEKGANGKSIIAILSMGLSVGTQIRIEAQGEDEAAAVNSLIDLIDSGFNEE